MTTPVRVSWAVMDPASVGKIQLIDARHALASAFMPSTTAVSKRGGFLPGSGVAGAVTATSPTPDNFVSVAPFQLVLPSTRAFAGAVAAPPYIATNDRNVTFNAFATPPSAVANRRDLIILQQNDVSQSDATSEANLRYIVGNAPAADPAITGSPDYVILAQVVVRQNATSVLQSDITSRVPAGYLTVASGGVLPVASQAERDAVAGLYDGLTVFRADKGWCETRYSSGWRIHGIPTVSTFAALATDITHPYTGQYAAVSGEGRFYRYTGAAWVSVGFAQVVAAFADLASIGGAVNGDLGYVTGDGMLYRRSGGVWVANTPHSGNTAATRHDVEYIQSNNQSIPNTTATKVKFDGTPSWTSNDVVASGTGTVNFAFQRLGRWRAEATSRMGGTGGAERALQGFFDGVKKVEDNRGPSIGCAWSIAWKFKVTAVGQMADVQIYQDSGGSLTTVAASTRVWFEFCGE